jgi:hypothetical protein
VEGKKKIGYRLQLLSVSAHVLLMKEPDEYSYFYLLHSKIVRKVSIVS